MDMIIQGFLFVGLPVLVGVIAMELYDYADRWARALVVRAAQKLHSEHAERYAEEWLANLDEVPGKVSRLWVASMIYLTAGRVAAAIHMPVASAVSKLTTQNVRVARGIIFAAWRVVTDNSGWHARLIYAAAILTAALGTTGIFWEFIKQTLGRFISLM